MKFQKIPIIIICLLFAVKSNANYINIFGIKTAPVAVITATAGCGTGTITITSDLTGVQTFYLRDNSGNPLDQWTGDAISHDFTGLADGLYKAQIELNAEISALTEAVQLTNDIISGAAGLISGTDTVCEFQKNVPYTVPAITNAKSYIWVLPSGSTISTGTLNNIFVNFSSQTGDITVKGTNTCGDGTISAAFPVVVSGQYPAKSGQISGTSEMCKPALNYTYKTSEIAGALTYSWFLPAGASIISGEGNDTITVNFGESSGDITVRGFNSCGLGELSDTLSVFLKERTLINTQPLGDSICAGEPINLSVSVTGVPAYQWQKDNVNIEGATSSTYSITQTTQSDAGKYKCLISGCDNGDTQEALIFLKNTLITKQPEPLYTVNEGDTARISIETSGEIISYSWEKVSIGSIENNSNTLILRNLKLEDGGTYICIISDICSGITLSNTAVLSVDSVKLTKKPEMVLEGNTVILEVPNPGAGFYFQWRKDGADIIDNQKAGLYSGAKTFRLTIKNIGAENTGNYDCFITGPGFTSKSELFPVQFFVDVPNLNRKLFNIYPNPSSGIFNLDTKTTTIPENSIISIKNISGKTVYKNIIQSGKIDISNEPQGIYFIEIQYNNTILKDKIIIEK